MTAVPRLWPGATVVILAGGPSLTPAQVSEAYALDPAVKVIAIKESLRLAPLADCLYACDAKWWTHYGKDLAYDGPRYALEQGAALWAKVLVNTGERGLETKPTGLRTGRNSGYQAINLAVHFGARRIVLLGYDMQAGTGGVHHWFGDTRPPSYNWTKPPYESFQHCWPSIVAPLAAEGVEVLNATPGSALTVFPQVTLAQALGRRREACA